jgi:hypothetical protein
MEPIHRFLVGRGELSTSHGAMNLYEFLLRRDLSDNTLTVCGVSYSYSDLLSWASTNLQSESSGESPPNIVIKNAWNSASADQMDGLRELIRGVAPIPPDHPDDYYTYLHNAFGLRKP